MMHSAPENEKNSVSPLGGSRDVLNPHYDNQVITIPIGKLVFLNNMFIINLVVVSKLC
jgi:hypothetical protein